MDESVATLDNNNNEVDAMEYTEEPTVLDPHPLDTPANQHTTPGLTAAAEDVSPTSVMNTNFADPSPKAVEGAVARLRMTPLQQKLYEILYMMKSIGLTVDKLDMVEKMDGYFLILGPQSAGKTQLTASLAGCDAFVSSHKLSTRAPTRIIVIYSPDHDEEKIDLKLPSLKMGGVTFHDAKVMEGLSPKECQQAIKDCHNVICHEKGPDAIVSAEIEVTVWTAHRPTMVLLDIPGLASFGQARQVSRQIVNKYLKTKKVIPIVCSKVCSTADEYLSEVHELLGDAAEPVVVYTHPEKSADPDYNQWYDSDEPEATKTTPFYGLTERLKHGPNPDNPRPKPPAVAVLLKNTADKNQRDVTIREQTKVEADWFEKRVEAKEIPPELADHLGLDKLLLLLDRKLSGHSEQFMKSSLAAAVTEKGNCGEELNMHGVDPSKIDHQELKDYVKAKVEECLEEAVTCTEKKIREKWEEAKRFFDNSTLNGKAFSQHDGIKLAGETFANGEFGGNFTFEVECIIKAKVGASFDDDNVGSGMQIGRFSRLRTVYTKEVEALVAEYTQAFLKETKLLFKVFSLNLSMKVPNYNLDNLILGIIDLHNTEVVQPLFDNLHKKVAENEDNWSASYLIEDHADRRKELNKKLGVLEDIITGWKELLPDEELLPKKRSLSPSAAVAEEPRLTRSTSPKRPRSD